jgi:hypothetical protein
MLLLLAEQYIRHTSICLLHTSSGEYGTAPTTLLFLLLL